MLTGSQKVTLSASECARNTGTLTHTANTTGSNIQSYGVIFNAATLSVSGTIDVSNNGFSGGITAGPGNGPGVNGTLGASYGGMGVSD